MRGLSTIASLVQLNANQRVDGCFCNHHGWWWCSTLRLTVFFKEGCYYRREKKKRRRCCKKKYIETFFLLLILDGKRGWTVRLKKKIKKRFQVTVCFFEGRVQCQPSNLISFFSSSILQYEKRREKTSSSSVTFFWRWIRPFSSSPIYIYNVHQTSRNSYFGNKSDGKIYRQRRKKNSFL